MHDRRTTKGILHEIRFGIQVETKESIERMKKVKCSYKYCYARRPHFESQEDERPHQMVTVPDDHDDEAYCSISCACRAGAYNVRTGWIPKEERKPQETDDAM